MCEKFTKKFLKKNLFSDEQAQATTEYILLLAIAVSLAVILAKALRPIYRSIFGRISASFGKIFNGDLRTFPLHK